MARKRIFRIILKTLFRAITASIFLVTVLKWVPVRYTPLMLKRSIRDRSIRTQQTWVPLKSISPEIIQAVIAAEDNRFAQHHGFDWKELDKMWADHKGKGKRIRGCSTISQQVAKNVFTSGAHTWARKTAEAYWTVLIEGIWGKRRIMEVYLNVAETGPGLYGMEAAANHYYGMKAENIERKQACAIAASLSAPREKNPDRPTAALRKRQTQIYALMSKLKYPGWAL